MTLTSPVKGGQAWVVGGAVPAGDVWERVRSRNDEILLQKLLQCASRNSVGLWGYPSFPALRQDWRGAFMPFLCAFPLPLPKKRKSEFPSPDTCSFLGAWDPHQGTA